MRCPHGEVTWRINPDYRPYDDVSMAYIIESNCSCNGTHPHLPRNPGEGTYFKLPFMPDSREEFKRIDDERRAQQATKPAEQPAPPVAA